jgi:choline-glycine betaine transporter
MFSKSNLLATLVGFLAMFLVGYALWGVALTDFFAGHSTNDVMKDPPDLMFIALGNLISAFVISTLYGKWAGATYGAGSGFSFGVWIGIFTGLGIGLLMYGTSEIMDLSGYLVEAIVEILFYGLIGAIIGWIYKKTTPKAVSV